MADKNASLQILDSHLIQMGEKFNKLLNVIPDLENYKSRIKSNKDEQKGALKRLFKVRKLRYCWVRLLNN